MTSIFLREMKKSVLFLLFFSTFIFLGIFSSVFLPQIKVEITIQPQSQSFVNAHEPDSEAREKPHCVAISSSRFNTDEIINKINASYDKGYRLKGFSTTSTYIGAGIGDIKHFAAVCKE